MNMNHSLTTIERKTYSVLEWVGDVGGLVDGFKLVGFLIAWPIASFTIGAELLSSLFQLRLS